MNWNARIRQIHRWLSLAFTAAVVANIIALVLKRPETWIGLMAFAPLIPLLITGLYLFALPHVAAWRGGRRTVAGARAS